MRALTICQPYAHMIAIGHKWIENRRWRPPCVAIPLAIHAGKSRSWMVPDDLKDFPGMAFGAVVAVAALEGWVSADLARVRYDKSPSVMHPGTSASYRAIVEDPHFEGPVCWIFSGVQRLPEPVPATGARGMWQLPPEVLIAVTRQIKEPI